MTKEPIQPCNKNQCEQAHLVGALRGAGLIAKQAGPYGDKNVSYNLSGKVLTNSCFQFECGFTMPLGQIAWLFSIPINELKVGETLSFKVSELERHVPQHKHYFTCDCGAKHA